MSTNAPLSDRRPSAHAHECLTELLLDAGLPPERMGPVLARLGRARFVRQLVLTGSPESVWEGIVDTLDRGGYLNVGPDAAPADEFLGALEQEELLVRRASDFDRVRRAFWLLPGDVSVLPPKDLAEAQAAAQAAGLADAGEARFKHAIPLPVLRHTGSSLDPVDQVNAWFETANASDAAQMTALLDAAIAVARNLRTPTDRLERVLHRLRARVFTAPPPLELVAGLEHLVSDAGIMVDAVTFVERMTRALARVCLVRIDGRDIGTGFLVGRHLVLTAQHVLAPVLDGKIGPDRVELVFDYRTSEGVVSEGPRVRLLAHDWRVDDSPPTANEREPKKFGLPDIHQPTDPDCLDFALVRLAEPIGDSPAPDGRPREWFRLTPGVSPAAFDPGPAILIVGHPRDAEAHPPKCRPQTFAIEPDASLGVNPNGTRVRYRTNTLSGSSGSPVLSSAWELLAMHHFGRYGVYNQGIPTSAIAARPKVAAVLG